VKISTDINQEEINPYRMAARNGNSLPKHIMENQENQSKQKMIQRVGNTNK